MTDSTQLILPGASEAVLQALRTAGDMAYDHDNQVVRVGDGQTPGGIVLGSAQQVVAMGVAAIAPSVAATRDASAAAQLAADTALAAGNYYAAGRAAGEAATAVDGLFSTDDGGGNLIYYRRTAGGSVEIGRALTPAALAAVDGAGRVGMRQSGDGTVHRTLGSFEGQIRTQYDYGAVCDGVHDDTDAMQAYADACTAAGIPMMLAYPAVAIRTTRTVTIGTPIAPLGAAQVSWMWRPSALPQTADADMMPCIRIRRHYLGVGEVVEGIRFTGSEYYDANDPATYVNDAAYGPWRVGDAQWAPRGIGGPAGGWYHEWLKPGTCAIYVEGASQPQFRRISCDNTIKVGICLDNTGGHVKIAKTCSLESLISVRVICNGDDLQFDDEALLNGELVGLLCGTTPGEAAAGVGVRRGAIYSRAKYGILQLNDHGPYGSPYTGPYADGTPPPGVYGDLNGAFFEAVGECAIRMLPNSVVPNAGLKLEDIARMTWDPGNALPTSLLPADKAQEAMIYLGLVNDNVRIGTDTAIGVDNYYISQSSTNPDRTGIYIDTYNGGQNTKIARNIIPQLKVRARNGDLTLRTGLPLYQEDQTIAGTIRTRANLFAGGEDGNSWTPAITTIGGGAATHAITPWQMREEFQSTDPKIMTLLAGKVYQRMPFDDLAQLSRLKPIYLSFWAYAELGASLRAQLDFRDANDNDADVFLADQTFPTGYFDQYAVTGSYRVWRRIGIAPINHPGRIKRLTMIANGGTCYITPPMISIGQPAPYNATGGVEMPGGLTVRSNLELDGRLYLYNTGATGTAPAAGAGQALPATPRGYMRITIEGVPCCLPFYDAPPS